MVLRKFLKADSRIMTQGLRAAGYEMSGKGHILQQSTFPALKQLAIIRENAQGSRLFLHRNQARGKLAKIVPPLAHVRLVLARLARYGAARAGR